MSRTHGVLPDTQCKPGVQLQHMTWAGWYFAHRMPHVIVHVGDHWDMPSLSHYDKGTMAAEGRAYEDDIGAGNLGMDLFMRPIRRKQRKQALSLRRNRWRAMQASDRRYVEAFLDTGKTPSRPPSALLAPWFWVPRLVFCIGNHEQRIMRHVNANPELRGTLGYHCFNLEAHGWEVHDFLHPVTIDDLSYQHYIPNPNTGRPWGGMAEPRLSKIGYSFVSGHEQGKKSGERYLQNKRTQRALIVGSYYLHDESYKGPQGNYHWRGLCMLHEVGKGDFDLMEVRMRYIREAYVKNNPKANMEPVRYAP